MSFDFDIKVPTRRVVRGVQAYEAAREAVRPYVGDVGYACDSADGVYEQALRQLGHDTSGLVGHTNAPRVVLDALKGQKAKPRTMATDSKTISRRNQMFPNGNRLR